MGRTHETNRGADLLAREGRTQEEIAEAVGTSHVAVGKWLRASSKPDTKKRQKLLGLYGIAVTAWDEVPAAPAKKKRTKLPDTALGMAARLRALCHQMFEDIEGDARVIMTSKTARQVESILWRELRMMVTRSGRCLACKLEDERTGRDGPRPCRHSAIIEGKLGEKPHTGLTSGFREVIGYTAREADAFTGTAGRNLMFIFDEAAGIAHPRG